MDVEHAVERVRPICDAVAERGADAIGIVVTSHDGRPTKVEGNSLHPSSHGATDVRARVAAGLGIDHLVPEAVARYIDQHHLYLAP